MTVCNWSPEAWSALAAGLTAFSALAASFAAIRGINSWRAQENFRIDMDLSKRIITSKHALRRGISSLNKLQKKSDGDEQFFGDFSEIIGSISNNQDNLLMLAAEAKVLWGFKKRKVFDFLEEMAESLDDISANFSRLMSASSKLTEVQNRNVQLQLPSTLAASIIDTRREISALWESNSDDLRRIENLYNRLSSEIDDIIAARVRRAK